MEELKTLLASCTIKPVVNQILLHPYVIASTTPLLEYMAEQHIVPEGYSTLVPLTSKPGGPVDKPINKLAEKYGAKPEQILIAWSKAKQYVYFTHPQTKKTASMSRDYFCYMYADVASAVIVTTSSKKDRLEGYLKVGDIDLTPEEVESIDKAGAKGELWDKRKVILRSAAKWAAVSGLALYAIGRILL